MLITVTISMIGEKIISAVRATTMSIILFNTKYITCLEKLFEFIFFEFFDKLFDIGDAI